MANFRLATRVTPFCAQSACGLLLCLLAALPALDQPAQAEAILHAFGWSYQDIARQAAAIAVGIAIENLLPPVAAMTGVVVQRRIAGECGGILAFVGHLVHDQIGVGSHSLGLKGSNRLDQALFVAVAVVDQPPVLRLIAQIPGAARVLGRFQRRTHQNGLVAGVGDGRLDNGILPNDHHPDGLFGPQDFHPEGCIRNDSDRESVQRDRICGAAPDRGLPDLNDTDPRQTWVNQQRRHYVQALYNLGIRGFRIDAAKHMPLSAIRSFLPESISRKAHIFAEIITWGGATDQQYQLYLEPYLRALPAEFGAYDFPLLHALKRAFAPDGRLSDLAFAHATGNALENRRAVTVAVTHDIPYNNSFRSLILDAKDEELAYAYILGRDGGSPLVFDDGTPQPSDGGRWAKVWNRPLMKAMLGFHNRLQGQPMEVLASDGCALLWRRGEAGIVALNKCNQAVSFAVDTRFRFKWNHPYRDVLSNQPLPPIQGPSATFTIPARTAQMWLAQ